MQYSNVLGMLPGKNPDFLVLKKRDRQWGRIVSVVRYTINLKKIYFRRDSLENLSRSWNDNINMNFRKGKDWI
jgi:hypothetical protein